VGIGESWAQAEGYFEIEKYKDALHMSWRVTPLGKLLTSISIYYSLCISPFAILHYFMVRFKTFLGPVVAIFAEWWSGPTSSRGRTLYDSVKNSYRSIGILLAEVDILPRSIYYK
jgi:hypothetical protein